LGIIWVFFTPHGVSLWWTTRSSDNDHDRLSLENEWSHKHEKDVIEEGHQEEDRRNAHAVELDERQEHDAHAGAHDILCHPEEGVRLGMTDGKGYEQPGHSQSIGADASKQVNCGNITNVFNVGSTYDLVRNATFAKDDFKDRQEDDLHDGPRATKAIKDLDNLLCEIEQNGERK
jgi:hypothetical protein